MIPNCKTVPRQHYIPLFLRIIIPEHLQYLNLNLPLLMQLLLILEYLHGHLLLLWMCVIYASDDDPECPSAQFLDNFVPIVDLICLLIQVITIFGVKTEVVNLLTVRANHRWLLLLLLCA